MKLTFFLVFSSVILSLSISQPVVPDLLYTIEFGDGVYYQNDYRGTSPIQLSPIDGRKVWIGQAKNGLIADIFSGKIEKSIPFTENRSGGYDVEFAFGNGWAVGNRGNPVVMYLDVDKGLVSEFKYYYDEDDSYELMVSNAYIINDHAFLFQKDGTLFCIPKGKAPLSALATKALLRSWVESGFLPDAQVRQQQIDLVDTGKFLIVDGVNYPATNQDFRAYLVAMGRDSSAIEQRGRGSPVVGVSALGEVYIRRGESVIVLDQNGKSLSEISLSPFFGAENNQERILYFSVHPNGDLFAMNAVMNDKVYVFRAVRTWGSDLLHVARTGVTKDDEVKSLSSNLATCSNAELKLLRNAVYALQGYEFRTWDLRIYFSGYDWYTPRPGLPTEISNLAEPQQQLLILILAEEKRRKRA